MLICSADKVRPPIPYEIDQPITTVYKFWSWRAVDSAIETVIMNVEKQDIFYDWFNPIASRVMWSVPGGDAPWKSKMNKEVPE